VRKILIFIAFLISGCATTDKYVLEPGNTDELATLYIYRTDTSFHSLNPELPYIYIADKVAAKLGTGEFKVIKVLPGKHRLSVRQPIMFMPGTESDSFEYDFKAGETYYVRYSMEFGGAAPVENTISVYGSSNFGLTNRENYEARK